MQSGTCKRGQRHSTAVVRAAAPVGRMRAALLPPLPCVLNSFTCAACAPLLLCPTDLQHSARPLGQARVEGLEEAAQALARVVPARVLQAV